MAVSQAPTYTTFPASGDLSSYQWHIMTLNTSGQVKVADDADDTAEPMLGILVNKPTVANQAAKVCTGGVTKMIADEAINEGSWITCSEDATDKGQGIATTTVGDHFVGYSVTACSDAEFFQIMVAPGVHSGVA